MDADEWRALHPSIVRVWRAGAALVAIPVLVMLLFVALIAGHWVWWVVWSLAAAWFAWMASARVARRYRAWRYRFGPDSLELRRGVWWHVATSVPYHRIQQVDVNQGPIQRHYGMVELRLRTASAGSDCSLPGVPQADADELRAWLAARAERDDGA
ncbi:MAG: PH domain-containing protein [Actinomycetota bacterium]|nr:PH domain-containing protein [Actinomycetota bacterium]